MKKQKKEKDGMEKLQEKKERSKQEPAEKVQPRILAQRSPKTTDAHRHQGNPV
jgi:hypothetical protein